MLEILLCSFIFEKRYLTHISLASHFWYIGKHCRPRGVWSGSTLFAHRNFYQKYDKKMYTRHALNEKWTRPIDNNGKVH